MFGFIFKGYMTIAKMIKTNAMATATTTQLFNQQIVNTWENYCPRLGASICLIGEFPLYCKALSICETGIDLPRAGGIDPPGLGVQYGHACRYTDFAFIHTDMVAYKPILSIIIIILMTFFLFGNVTTRKILNQWQSIENIPMNIIASHISTMRFQIDSLRKKYQILCETRKII